MYEIGLILAVTLKDLRQELRSKVATFGTLFFTVVTLMILAFALGSDEEVLRKAAPGALWVALAFAGIIAAAQSYVVELEEGAFEVLLSTQIPRGAIFLGKFLANWLYMAIVGTMMLPVALLLYGEGLGGNWLLLEATILLGTFGFSVVASFYAALTANLRARDSLLPVLMFPVVVPVLLAAVRATGEIVGVADLDVVRSWLRLLIGFDLIYAVICTACFGYLVDE